MVTSPVTTYVMAGLAREQVCTYMCPYARFQGVMFDKDTLIVAYDETRGERSEGRHKPSKGNMTHDERKEHGVGDCIDCGLCVQVCPTGIDIRNGMQYQCISCALCIDACNTIMDSINFPRGLIRYTSEKSLEGKRSNPFNLKNIGYAIGLLITAGLLVWGVATRSVVELSVEQIRQPLSVTLSDGRIENRYDVKINNKLSHPVTYEVVLEGLEGAELDLGGANLIKIEAEGFRKLFAKVRRDPKLSHHTQEEYNFVLKASVENEQILEKQVTIFYTPERLIVK